MNNQDLPKPQLRKNLKISRMRQSEKTTYVIKDPLKEQFYKFDQSESAIIELFDGTKTVSEIVEAYNKKNPLSPIEAQTILDFQEGLEKMGLMVKSQKDLNIMLVERMKEMRQGQLLSQKGSLFYKRFPIIDPDRLFNKVIDKIRWIWTVPMFITSLALIFGAVFIVILQWHEFKIGMEELFTFSEMSVWNLAALWVVIYATIAIHELGHGLTCKHYGGEVHEIGFLLLFFQPCLYCNVNDAWLFDKKWKQIMVTMAGGYIEITFGAVCAFIWYFSNPNTFLHTISFQVMTICSLSTVFMNFNPLMKLDGYYLLSDFLEVPNLKDDSFDYLKYFVKKYIFRMNEPEFEATSREKFIYMAYGTLSFCWMFGTLTGMFFMVKGLLLDKLYFGGIILAAWAFWKMAGNYVEEGVKFMVQWYLLKKEMFKQRKIQYVLGSVSLIIIFSLLFPFSYRLSGECELHPSFIRVVHAQTSGTVKDFQMLDGSLVKPGDKILEIENLATPIDREIASISLEKQKQKYRQSLIEEAATKLEMNEDLQLEKLKFADKEKKLLGLSLVAPADMQGQALLSCPEYVKRKSSFFKEGEEICRLNGASQLMTEILVQENQIRFLKEGQEVKFKLTSHPFETYSGKVKQIHKSADSDPKNPKLKLYRAVVIIDNSNLVLRPGMTGKAKIFGENVNLLTYAGIKLAENFRIDLFSL